MSTKPQGLVIFLQKHVSVKLFHYSFCTKHSCRASVNVKGSQVVKYQSKLRVELDLAVGCDTDALRTIEGETKRV